MNLVEKARQIAGDAHAGQKRWGGEHFITHPAAVAAAVADQGDYYAAAAWLHDVIEDSNVTLADLREQGIPSVVVEAVAVLTQTDDESYLDYILQIKATGGIALAVKLADLAHNLSTADPVRNKGPITKWELARYILEH